MEKNIIDFQKGKKADIVKDQRKIKIQLKVVKIMRRLFHNLHKILDALLPIVKITLLDSFALLNILIKVNFTFRFFLIFLFFLDFKEPYVQGRWCSDCKNECFNKRLCKNVMEDLNNLTTVNRNESMKIALRI